MSITVDFYSEKAIVVRNTLEHHGPIMEQLGGTFNEKLRGGRGWIFSKFKMTQVRNIVDKLNSGQYGNEYEQKSVSSVTSVAAPAISSSPCIPVDMVSKAEFLSVVSRLERLEALVANLCHLNPAPSSSQLERLEALVANVCHLTPTPSSSQLVQSSSQLVQSSSQLVQSSSQLKQQNQPIRMVEEDDFDPSDDQDEPPTVRKRLVSIQRK